MALEVAGGLISGSLALLADAGHMLTDTAALALAWIAARLTLRPTNSRRSYGYHRAQVLAAFVNAIALFLVVIWIVMEAVDRLATPLPIEGGTMLGVALADCSQTSRCIRSCARATRTTSTCRPPACTSWATCSARSARCSRQRSS
jgi:cation diffusion facilitator family transporter